MKHLIGFQIEPQRWPADSEGFSAEALRGCGVGYAATYDFRTRKITLYHATRLAALARTLRLATFVVGYNCVDFDRHLLTGSGLRVGRVCWLDLLKVIAKRMGHRMSLDTVIREINQSADAPASLDQHRQWIKNQDQRRMAEKCVNGALEIAQVFEYMRQGGKLTSNLHPSGEKFTFQDVLPKAILVPGF